MLYELFILKKCLTFPASYIIIYMNNNSKLNNNKGILDPEGKNLNPLNDKPYSEKYKSLFEGIIRKERGI